MAVDNSDNKVVPTRRKRPRPVLNPSTPEQIAQAFKDFEGGPDKKWSLRDEVWCILEGEYPFPIRQKWTLTQALLTAFPKWWILNWVEECAFPAIPVLYEVNASMGQNQSIKIECALIPPFNRITDEEWDFWEKGIGRSHDVLFTQFMREAPKPNPEKIAQLRNQ